MREPVPLAMGSTEHMRLKTMKKIRSRYQFYEIAPASADSDVERIAGGRMTYKRSSFAVVRKIRANFYSPPGLHINVM
jgi:hypothetical protein